MKNDIKSLSYKIMSDYKPQYKSIIKINIKLLFSLIIYLRTFYIYKKHGLKDSLEFARKFRKEKSFSLNKEECIYISKQLIPFFRFFGRLVGETGNCLERSICLYAALGHLGIYSQLILAKPKKRISLTYGFHAWIEYQNTPLNDVADVADSYFVLTQY